MTSFLFKNGVKIPVVIIWGQEKTKGQLIKVEFIWLLNQ